MMIVSEYGSVLWIGSPYGSPSTDFTYNSGLQILSVSICNGIYQMLLVNMEINTSQNNFIQRTFLFRLNTMQHVFLIIQFPEFVNIKNRTLTGTP